MTLAVKVIRVVLARNVLRMVPSQLAFDGPHLPLKSFPQRLPLAQKELRLPKPVLVTLSLLLDVVSYTAVINHMNHALLENLHS